MREDGTIRALRGPYAGRTGQVDAPYWPTPPALVERMLDLAAVGPGDRLKDLGCGDGRIVLAAARRGASALGVDLDAARIAEAEAATRAAGLSHLARFRRQDLFATSLARATVVTLYLAPHVNRLLRDRLGSALRPGSRVVGHAFSMPGWAPVREEESADRRRLYLWVVPSTP